MAVLCFADRNQPPALATARLEAIKTFLGSDFVFAARVAMCSAIAGVWNDRRYDEITERTAYERFAFCSC